VGLADTPRASNDDIFASTEFASHLTCFKYQRFIYTLMQLRAVIAAYLIAVHALLVVALVKTDLIPRVAIKFGLVKPLIPEEESIIPRLREVHQQMDSSVPAGAIIFLGDSITMALATAAIAPFAVNYGIGWQRSDQLIKSMDIYQSIKRAGRVVITIGTNDVLQGRESGIESRYQAILAKIPSNVAVIMSSVPPIGDIEFGGRKIADTKVRYAVASAKRACEADRRCRFVNAYEALTSNRSPLPGVLLGDGVHLAPKGYELWISAIRRVSTGTQ